MTAKDTDNVGGLRLAEEVEAIVQFFHSARLFVTSREKIKHPEGTALYDEFLDRLAKLADGELCRAAPAGGESLGENGKRAIGRCIEELNHYAENPDDYGFDEMGVQALKTAIESMQMRLSAPAGSGEVSDAATWLAGMAAKRHWRYIGADDKRRLAEIAALLRKLQQGAE